MEQFKHAAAEAGSRAHTLWGEFRTFAFKGNVIDLAIGVIIGTAFAKLIDSLVKNVLMPLLSIILPGEQSYATWGWEFRGTRVPFGLFVGELVNFLIIALALFLFAVKFLGWVAQVKKKEEAAPQPPTKEQQLLTEIRDLLKDRKEGA